MEPPKGDYTNQRKWPTMFSILMQRPEKDPFEEEDE